MIPAAYRIADVTPETIFLVDLSDLANTASITNDASRVIRDVVSAYPGRRVIYRDSDGIWSEILHNNGIMTGFAPCHYPVPVSDHP